MVTAEGASRSGCARSADRRSAAPTVAVRADDDGHEDPGRARPQDAGGARRRRPRRRGDRLKMRIEPGVGRVCVPACRRTRRASMSAATARSRDVGARRRRRARDAARHRAGGSWRATRSCACAYADGFSHARSMAFLISLVLVQGVIGLVGLASWLGETGPGVAIVRTIEEVAPGPVGQHAHRRGRPGVHEPGRRASGSRWCSVSSARSSPARRSWARWSARSTGSTASSRTGRRCQKYGRAFVLAVTRRCARDARRSSPFAFGDAIGDAFGDDTVASDLERGPVAARAACSSPRRWRCCSGGAPNRHQPAWSWLAFG